MHPLSRAFRPIGFAVGAVALCAGIALAQSDVSVSLNGAPLPLNPAPQERSGRIFVPLRGIFERLGASVVYENGTINAQGGGHSVSLHIGSTQATVDGQNQTLDVAPFMIGDSTYVPLRFVSQALGTNVNYDSSNRIVALSNGGSGAQYLQQQSQDQQQRVLDQQQRAQVAQQQQQRTQAAQQQQQRALELQQQQQRAQADQQRQQQRSLDQQQQRIAEQQPSPLTLAVVHPGRSATVSSRRPTVEADFGNAQADPNSIRVSIDGLDVTGQASRSPRGVVFSPPSDLQSGRHDVRVVGNDQNGNPFDDRWSFTSGTAVVSNRITNLLPGEGSAVHDQFIVSGRTMPGARVVVQVGTVATRSAENVIGQLLGVGNGSSSVRSEVIADGNGNFRAPMEIQAHSGQQMTLVVDSTDARSQSAAPRLVRNLTAE